MAKKRIKAYYKLTALLAVICIGVGAYFLFGTNNKKSSLAPTATPTSTQTVNLDPPTEAEKTQTDQHKDDLTQSTTPTTPSTPTNSTSKKKVQPFITYVDTNTINSYVSGVLEDGGTCTATLTQGTTTIVASSSGFKNVSYTQCAPIDLSKESVGSGTWSVVLKYSSATAEGTSSTVSLAP